MTLAACRLLSIPIVRHSRLFCTLSQELKDSITKAAAAIKEADAVLIAAGAGIGVDSGLPDFRGNEGFWKAYPPMKKLGASFSDMANPYWFHNQPRIAWGFYGHRLNMYKSTTPHQGYTVLLNIMNSKKAGGFVFTTNVDGQFHKAGFPPEKILEIHGSIHHVQCLNRCNLAITEIQQDVIVDPVTIEASESTIPKCPASCGSIARPNVLMFMDATWIGDRANFQRMNFYQWTNSIGLGSKLAVIEVGAGTAIPTLRTEGTTLLQNYHGWLIRINTRESKITDKTLKGISIPLPSLQALTEIEKLL